jgi:hypothetical protein
MISSEQCSEGWDKDSGKCTEKMNYQLRAVDEPLSYFGCRVTLDRPNTSIETMRAWAYPIQSHQSTDPQTFQCD